MLRFCTFPGVLLWHHKEPCASLKRSVLCRHSWILDVTDTHAVVSQTPTYFIINPHIFAIGWQKALLSCCKWYGAWFMEPIHVWGWGSSLVHWVWATRGLWLVAFTLSSNEPCDLTWLPPVITAVFFFYLRHFWVFCHTHPCTLVFLLRIISLDKL